MLEFERKIDRMAKYKTILFDVDNTLFDFDKDQEIAFKEAMNIIGHPCTEKMYEDYNQINIGMWEMLNRGEITAEELSVKRFKIFFEKYQIKQDAQIFSSLLTQAFQKTGTPIKGSREILEQLKDKYELVIISNGFKRQQYHRLNNAKFSRYFSKIFLSEEIGYSKPDKNFFDVVLQNIENKEKSKILIIGDSISADIAGGKNAEIDTCWYNPKNKENATNIQPNYEIKDFKELLKII